MSDPSVQTAWETLHTKIYNRKISVDESTMASRDLVKELTLMNLNAPYAPNISNEIGLYFQKRSNLCAYFATMSAVRNEMKQIIGNATSTDINWLLTGNAMVYYDLISIPAGKSIDDLFKEKEFQALDFNDENFDEKEMFIIRNFPNALSFVRMLSVLLCCVSPRALSGLVKTSKIHFKIIIFFKYWIIYFQVFPLS